MKTQKQEELVKAYLDQLDDEMRPLYREIVLFLSAMGYNPKKEKSSISFKHDLHNKQLVKLGIKTGKQKESSPSFSLRFSACRGYSQRFADIVDAYMKQYPARIARCTDGGCNYCAGEADTHVYKHECLKGEREAHCGAYAIEIPNMTVDDIGEIKKLLEEEHAYLQQHEADAS